MFHLFVTLPPKPLREQKSQPKEVVFEPNIKEFTSDSIPGIIRDNPVGTIGWTLLSASTPALYEKPLIGVSLMAVGGVLCAYQGIRNKWMGKDEKVPPRQVDETNYLKQCILSGTTNFEQVDEAISQIAVTRLWAFKSFSLRVPQVVETHSNRPGSAETMHSPDEEFKPDEFPLK